MSPIDEESKKRLRSGKTLLRVKELRQCLAGAPGNKSSHDVVSSDGVASLTPGVEPYAADGACASVEMISGIQVFTIFPSSSSARHSGDGHRLVKNRCYKQLTVIQHVPFPLLCRCQRVICKGCVDNNCRDSVLSADESDIKHAASIVVGSPVYKLGTTYHSFLWLLRLFNKFQNCYNCEHVKLGLVEAISDSFLALQMLRHAAMPPAALAVYVSCVPEPEVLKEFVSSFARIFLVDLCLEIERVTAMGTRIHKIDGDYKLAKPALWDKAEVTDKYNTVALVVTQDEGFLAFVPGLAVGESREGFDSYYAEKIRTHRLANEDSPDKGMLVALGCDDMGYEMLLTEILAKEYLTFFRQKGLVAASAGDAARQLLAGKGKDLGLDFKYFLDPTHGVFTASSWPVSKVHVDYRDYSACIRGAQSRWSGMPRPVSTFPCGSVSRLSQEDTARIERVLKLCDESSMAAARKELAKPELQVHKTLAQEFIGRRKERQSVFFSRSTCFGMVPPREVVERFSIILDAKLHPSNLAWQWSGAVAYKAAVSCILHWFTRKHRFGVRRCKGIAQESEAAARARMNFGIMTQGARARVKTLLLNRRIQGYMNWKAVSDLCRAADIPVSSGTTETESMNGELHHLLFSHPINHVTQAWWNVCVRCAFVRIVYRRSHLGLLPNFVRGSHGLAARIEALTSTLLQLQLPTSKSLSDMETSWSAGVQTRV
jgi:hypothetical protein